MNARMYYQGVDPVPAVSATKEFNHQQDRQQLIKRVKKQKPFNSLFQAAYNVKDASSLAYATSCYGKDAQPVVRNVSSFDQTS